MKYLMVPIFLILAFFCYAENEWKKYPYQPIGSSISFPKDEGKHAGIPNLEWWYVVMHVKGKISGHDYSILVTHFNNTFRLFTISDITEKTHISGTTRGKLDSVKNYMDVRQTTDYGVDSFRTKRDNKNQLIPFEYEVETHHDQMYIKADLVALKPPMMVQDDGHFKVGKSGTTYYYSLTRLKTQGVLTYAGLTEPFEGIAWIDHQWGPFFVSPVEVGDLFESYEWFCIQLNDGSDIMVINIYDRDRKIPMHSNYIAVEKMDFQHNNEHTIDREFLRNGYWQDPVSNHIMSMGWTLKVPSWNLHLDLVPDFVDQMVKMPLNGDFWEGSISVKGKMDGKEVKGVAFGELIHRFEQPKLRIMPLKNRYSTQDLIKLKFKLKNPDDGNPLRYTINLITDNSRLKLMEVFKPGEYQFKASELLFAEASSKYKIEVEASSVDMTLSSHLESEEFTIR